MKIIGTGAAVPKLSVTNDALAEFLDTSDEWITSRTGIRSRRILSNEQLEELAAEAARQAMQDAGIQPEDVDFIIVSNVYSSHITPGMGCLLHEMLHTSCASIDINGACAGFLYGLEMAQAYLYMGSYNTILFVCAEAPSRMMDWTDRSTCVLFGDAAAAVVLRPGGEDIYFKMSNTPGSEFLYSTNPPGNCPYVRSAPDVVAVQMNGQEVYKFAVSTATRDIRELCMRAGLPLGDVGHFLLHQANLRILEAIRMRLKQAEGKFPHNIELYGNTSSASLPLLLNEMKRSGQLKPGEYIAMSAFGAGLTAGSCLMRWE